MENWLPVTRYEGLYEVSCRGRVRSLRHLTHIGWRGGRVLRQSLSTARKFQVTLYRDGRGESVPVHRLVLREFAGECPPGQESRHGPGGQLDNRWPENLCWGTHSQNMLDRTRDGTQTHGAQNGYSKLTAADVLDIRRRLVAGESQRSIARSFHVTQVNISMINRRKTWTHI